MGKRRKKRPAGPFAPGAAARGTLRLGLVLAVLVVVNLYVFLFRDDTSIPEVMNSAHNVGVPPAPPTVDDRVAGEAAAAPAEDPGRWVEGAVGKGDSMGQILRREGLTPPEADELIRALSPELDLRKIQAGQSYRIHFDDAGALLAFEYEVSRVLRVRAERGADGALSARRIEAGTETRIIELGGVIDSSLYASIKDAGESTALVAFFVDVFAYDINFYVETHAGDEFRMIVEKIYLDGEFYGYGRVLAAEYRGRVGTYHAFFWKAPDAKTGRYFGADGKSVEKTFLKSPLKYARVSSRFNPKRMHPILHRTKGHWGTDYAAPIGTPVWAAASGKIVYRGAKGGAGNCVVIKHDNGMQTTYMHLHRFHKGQAVGQRVRQKDVIGYVGKTGLATGPHLHFGLQVNGRYVDPAKMKMQPGPPVPGKWKDRFRADTGALVARLDEIEARPTPPTAVAVEPAVTPSAAGAAALALPK